MDVNSSADGAAASAAAVSVSRPPVFPASRAFDTAIWRVVGNPLVPSPAMPAESGSSGGSASVGASLQGLGVAVKDLFAVKGFAIGAGNPRFLAESAAQHATAPAVMRLMEAGASIVGIAQTDEFAYSLAGTNAHYGTPPNPCAPGRISGGSSSGPAAAVATGQADVGLGTDTAGSLRIPGSYEGLWAIRTTWNRVPRDLVHPLSQSFDTVGLLARDPKVFIRAVDALMPDDDSIAIPDAPQAVDFAVAPGLDAAVEPDVAEAVDGFRRRLVAVVGRRGEALSAPSSAGSSSVTRMEVTPEDLDWWESIFQSVRGYEAWRNNGAWVGRNWDALAPDIAARFRRDSRLAQPDYEEGLRRLRAARAELRERLGNRVLVIPTASSVAPPASASQDAARRIASARAATIRLTSLAGVGGLPAVNIPLRTHEGLPCGVCLVGPADSDRSLARLAVCLLRICCA